MKISLHAQNDIDIITHYREKTFNVNEVDDTLNISETNHKNLKIYVYNFETMKYDLVSTSTVVRIAIE